MGEKGHFLQVYFLGAPKTLTLGVISLKKKGKYEYILLNKELV